MEMIAFTSFKKHKLLPILLLAVTASIVLAGIPPIQAISQATPKLVVGPTTYVAAGSLTKTAIKVQSMVPFDAFDIAVFADSGAIDPQSISIGSALVSPLVLTNCVDGAGIGCSINDGPGIAHLAAASGTGAPSTVHNGVIFTVTWKAVDSVSSVVAISCQLFASAGVQVSGISLKDNVYSSTGTVPASALPNFSVSASQTVAVPAGSSQSVIVTVVGVNGFADDVALSATTSSPSVTATLAPAGVSCNCVGVAMSTLTITTTTSGTFTVTVTGISPPPGPITQSFTITVTA
ncbi:hypothetical protein E6H37_01065 [Candidatus Bathyarchaeota archaeon]|nr:MAG: hypothetical protein E6H37_01065 [Candidatus Bathyarchaeota archaeon]